MNIHVAALKRLFVGWLLITLVIGAVGYWFGLRQIGQQLTDLAQAEIVRVAPLIVARVNGNATQVAELQTMAENYELRGFAVVQVFDRAGKLVAKKTAVSAAPLVSALGQQLRIPLLRDRSVNAERLSSNGQEAIRLAVPLFDGDLFVGHVEGVYIVPPDQLAGLHGQIRELVLVALIATALTTVLLYPFIISLDRQVQREARRILRGNLDLMGVLGSAIAKRDAETNAHNYRVTLYAVSLAERVGMSPDEVRALICGALLHDLGKIGIRDDILLKPGRLTEAEFAVMRQHVPLGLEIAAHSEWLRQAEAVIGGHHEWFDGSGYPAGLAGEAIPLAARVFAIVDVFDALASQRHYKARMSLADAQELLSEQAGTHFDPQLTRVFLQIAPVLHAQTQDLDDDALKRRLADLLTQYWSSGNWFGTARRRLGFLASVRMGWRHFRHAATSPGISDMVPGNPG